MPSSPRRRRGPTSFSCMSCGAVRGPILMLSKESTLPQGISGRRQAIPRKGGRCVEQCHRGIGITPSGSEQQLGSLHVPRSAKEAVRRGLNDEEPKLVFATLAGIAVLSVAFAMANEENAAD